MGRRALNASVGFFDVLRVTEHVGSRVEYTPNIFVHSWGVNPTDTIPANVSTITWRAYDPFRYFHEFVLRSNHESIRLKRIKLKLIRVKDSLARIRQDFSDKVSDNVSAPINNALGDALSNDSDSDDVWLDRYDSNWKVIISFDNVSVCDWLITCINLFT